MVAKTASKRTDRIENVQLTDIVSSRETQIRVAMCETTVQRYFNVMEDEESLAKFPPILLYRDQDGKLWLADGHHRVAAALQRGFTTIHAIIIDGSKSDAIWAAAQANGKNGLQLGRADIRRAVEMVCAACPDRSNVIIAETLGCDEKTVRKYRPEKSGSDLSEPEKRLGKDGKSYSVNRQKKEAEEEPENEQQIAPPTEEWQFEEGYPPLSQPIPEKDSQFVQTVKLQNIPLNDPERLIACLFDLFSVEYREKLIHDLMAKMRTKDGEATPRRIMKKMNKTFPLQNPEKTVSCSKTSLKPIQKNRPDLLVKNVLDDFPKEFPPAMAHEIFRQLHRCFGEHVTGPLATEIYEEYGREEKPADAEAESPSQDGNSTPETITVTLKSSPKIKEHYRCGVRFEPDPDDDVFDWLSEEEREELEVRRKNCPNRIVPYIHSFTIQSIPEHQPEPLIRCLYMLFKQNYRKKLLLALAREMRIKDGEEFTKGLIAELSSEFQ